MVGTPEIEARDFRQDLLDSNSQGVGSFWGRTFGQAFSWMNNKTNNQQIEENSFTNNNSSNPIGSTGGVGVSLNAYLTYVTLKLPLIMQGKKINLFRIKTNLCLYFFQFRCT